MFDSDKFNEILNDYDISLKSISSYGEEQYYQTEVVLMGNISNLIKICNDIIEDRELRKKHPSVENAYQEYQLIKRICKGENNNK